MPTRGLLPIAVICVLAFPASALAQPREVYSDTFGEANPTVMPGVNVSWSHPQNDLAPVGRWFRGRFGNDAVLLTVSNLPPHSAVILRFQLYLIDSWDGNGATCCGEQWQLRAASSGRSQRLLYTTFSNVDINATQTYPNSIVNGVFTNHARYTGAAEINTLRYNDYGDSVYSISRTVTDRSSQIAFTFSGHNLQDYNDESWGLDNLQVLVIPSGGSILTWGSNFVGQLGDTTTMPSSTAVMGPLGSNASAGYRHGLAIRHDGGVQAWGANTHGALGIGAFPPDGPEFAADAVHALNVTNAVQVSAGVAHSLALTADGRVWSWGANTYGQLGHGHELDVSAPEEISGLTNVMAIAAGHSHSIALKDDGTVWEWGLSWGESTYRVTPTPVPGLSRIVAVSAGWTHSLALNADGMVFGWGDNSMGQVGVPGAGGIAPVFVPLLKEVIAVSAGGEHSLALKADGTVFAWGGNNHGELGDGSLENRPPFTSPYLGGIVAISAGLHASGAIAISGDAFQWGFTSTTAPSLVSGIRGAFAISMGETFGPRLVEAIGPFAGFSIDAPWPAFENSYVGVAAPSEAVILRHAGGPPFWVLLGSVSLRGPDADAFTVTGYSPGIQPGGVASIALDFTPTHVGPHTAELVISSNSGRQTIPLVGNGLARSPDLREGLLTAPPSAAPGASIAVTDDAQNAGVEDAGASTTRFYLSLDAVKGAGDILLTGSRAVPLLGPLQSSTGTTSVKIAATAPLGTYWLLACADDTNVVSETYENNNCFPRTLLIALPDLTTTTTSHPGSGSPGSKVTLTDSVRNDGPVESSASTTRYYLSTDALKSAADILLTGKRLVGVVAPGADATGSQSVTIPLATTPAAYHVLACADDIRKVAESNEVNNCAASPTTLLVGLPDLVTTSVTDPPATVVPGGRFTITDTVLNQGNVAAGASYTSYYLSVDEVRDAGDVLLTGKRAVASLPAGAASAGSKRVTVPLSTPPGVYFVLACADATNAVTESDNTNNCRHSGTTVNVSP